MNHVIYKYPIEITDYQVIALPAFPRLLTVAMQGGTPCLWAIVDPNQNIRKRILRIYGDGHSIEQHLKFPTSIGTLTYINTIFLRGGAEPYHIFDGGYER